MMKGETRKTISAGARAQQARAMRLDRAEKKRSRRSYIADACMSLHEEALRSRSSE
jgi:hypothetical protein